VGRIGLELRTIASLQKKSCWVLLCGSKRGGYDLEGVVYGVSTTSQSCLWAALVDPWVGLGRVGSRFCSFRWVGLGWVEYDESTIFLNICIHHKW